MVYKWLSLQTPGQTYHIDIGGLVKSECRKMTRFAIPKAYHSITQNIYILLAHVKKYEFGQN